MLIAVFSTQLVKLKLDDSSKGTPKQFDSAAEIQIWKDVCFWLFFQFLCHMTQRNKIFFSVLFVALSHCDKQKFSLSHWITATNKKIVCRTESLRQTKFLYVAKILLKVLIMLNFLVLLGSFWHFSGLLCLFLHY